MAAILTQRIPLKWTARTQISRYKTGKTTTNLEDTIKFLFIKSKVSEEPPYPDGTNAPQGKGPISDSINQRISAGRVQEKSLVCCGPQPLEYSPLRDEICSHTTGLWKSLKTWLCHLALGPERACYMMGG